MLEQLIALVKEHAGDAIINNSAIPNEHNEAAVQTTAHGIMDVLKEQLTRGNIQSVMSIFTGGGQAQSQNPIMDMIEQSVGDKLGAQFGLKEGTGGLIAKMLIPIVMSKMGSKTADPNDNGFQLTDIMQVLSGNKLGGIDFNGVLQQVMGGGTQQPQQEQEQEQAPQQGGGLEGIFGMMKGLLGN